MKQRVETNLNVLDPNPEGQPAVLLLHGLGVDGSSWWNQIEALAAAGMRPVVPDVPGFGQSTFTGGRWSLRGATAQLTEWAQSHLPQPMVVVGISMGGVMALQMALDAPEMVGRLVLANTFASLRPRDPKQWLHLLKRFVIANLRGSSAQAELVAERLFPAPEQVAVRAAMVAQICCADPIVYRAAMRTLALIDLRRRLKEISQPTLVISAQNDRTVPLENQVELARGIRGAQHIIVEHAGHAVIIDQAALFNQHVLNFLTGTPAAQKSVAQLGSFSSHD